MENVAEVIKGVGFFSGLSREDLARVVGKFEEQRYSAGQLIVKQGAPADGMYVIESGAVEVSLEHHGLRVESVAILGPNEFFGEMSLFTGQQRSASVVALVDAVVLKLSNEAWEELLSRYPSISFHVCKILSQRLAETDRQLSKGRGSFKIVMESFFSAQSVEIQEFLLRTSILKTLQLEAIESALSIADPKHILSQLSTRYPLFLSSTGDGGDYEYLAPLKDFLCDKLTERVSRKERDDLHVRLAQYYVTVAQWAQAIPHYLQAEAWTEAVDLLKTHGDELLRGDRHTEILQWLDDLPQAVFHAHHFLTQLRAEAFIALGNLDAAIRCYQESLAKKNLTVEETLETARYYQELAELHQKKGELGEALGCLRMSLSTLEENKVGIDEIGAIRSIETLQQKRGTQEEALSWGKKALNVAQKLALHRRVRVISPDKKWWGLLSALAVGWALWHVQPPPPLDEKGMHFLASLAAATVLWFIDIFDEYIVSLGLLLVWVLTATASPEEALAGFAKASWFFVLGVLGIGAAVSQSGLLYRVALNMLRRVPPYYKLYSFILSGLGLVVTPLIPNNKARLAIIIPISQAISETFGFKPRSNATAGLTLSAYVGFSQMSFVFLTGANVCLIGWNLLPLQAKTEFAWGTWFLAALPAGLFTLFFLFVSIHLLFRPEEYDPSRYSPTTLKSQIEILGPLTYAEWLSLIVLALALLGWLGQPLLGINEAWVALAAFVFFLLAGVLDKSAVKNNIDWGYLLFTGVITSMAGVMTHLRVDRWLIQLMEPVLSSVIASPLFFLTSVLVLVYLVRFFLNKTPATIVLTVALIPWAQPTGIHPGVILLTILMGLECWFLVFQTDSYQIAYYITDEKGFTHAQARKLMVAKFVSSLIAVALSVAYWRTLGFIP